MKIVLFDIDGTLLVTNRAGSTAMHAALADEFGIDQPAVVDFAGRTDRGIIGEFFEHHGVDDSDENLFRFVNAYVTRLPSALAAMQGHVLPGVRELVIDLHEREEVAIGLLTGNLEQGARHKLAHFDLETFFPFGGFGDYHRERNAVARDALLAAETFLSQPVDPNDVLVIGDTVRDVACARAVGARVVAVVTGSHSRAKLGGARPDLLVDDLADHEPILALLD